MHIIWIIVNIKMLIRVALKLLNDNVFRAVIPFIFFEAVSPGAKLCGILIKGAFCSLDRNSLLFLEKQPDNLSTDTSTENQALGSLINLQVGEDRQGVSDHVTPLLSSCS